MGVVCRTLRWSQDCPLAYTSLSVKGTANMIEYNSNTYVTIYGKRNFSGIIKIPNQLTLANQKGDDAGRPENSEESVKETGSLLALGSRHTGCELLCYGESQVAGNGGQPPGGENCPQLSAKKKMGTFAHNLEDMNSANNLEEVARVYFLSWLYKDASS